MKRALKNSFKIAIGTALLFLASLIGAEQAQAGENDVNVVTDSDYTVTIPAEVGISRTTGSGTLQYTIAMNRTNTLNVNVTSASKSSATEGVLKNGDDGIGYSISGDTSATVTFQNKYYPESAQSKTINLQVDSNAAPKYAGEYSDQLVFNFSSVPIVWFDLNAYVNREKKGDLTEVGGYVDLYINDTYQRRVQDDWIQVNVGDKIKVCNFYTKEGYICEDPDPYEVTVGADDRLMEINLHYTSAPTITLDPCGGQIDVQSPWVNKGQYAVYTCKEGTGYALPDPTRNGYEFNGWWTGKEDEESAVQVSSSDTMGSESKMLYAHWKKNCTLTFNANGGSCDESSRTILQGEKIGSSRSLPTPTREYCEFAGWYTAKEGGDSVTEDTVMSGSDLTVYAHWIQFYLDINSYTSDDNEHHPHLYEYGTADITVGGNRNDSFDDGYLDKGTSFTISNITPLDGYEYVGYFMINYPVAEGVHLDIPDGGLHTENEISGTVSEYTSIYAVFKKTSDNENTQTEDDESQTASEENKIKDKTETETGTPETETKSETEASKDTATESAKDTSTEETASDTDKTELEKTETESAKTDKTETGKVENEETETGKLEDNVDDNSTETTEGSDVENTFSTENSGNADSEESSENTVSDTASNTRSNDSHTAP